MNTRILLVLAVTVLHTAAKSVLWFSKAADDSGVPSPLKAWEKENQDPTSKNNPDPGWEKFGLPVGNGFIGAMTYGGVALDRIQFNIHSLWSGGPGADGWKQNLNKPDAHEHLAGDLGLVVPAEHGTGDAGERREDRDADAEPDDELARLDALRLVGGLGVCLSGTHSPPKLLAGNERDEVRRRGCATPSAHHQRRRSATGRSCRRARAPARRGP